MKRSTDGTVEWDSSRAPALDGLAELKFSDLERYQAAVRAGEQLGWGYYFPYLLSRHQPGRTAILVAEDAGSVCVFLLRHRRAGSHLDILLAPSPMNVAVLRRCIERANEHNGNFAARVMRIDAKDIEALAGVRHLQVRERKSQYLYAPGSFANIGGRRYRTLRRNVALVEALPDVEVVPFSPTHAKACQALLRRWRKRHRDEPGGAAGAGTSGRAIEMAAQFPDLVLRGEVVFVDGRVSGFSFGGEIRPGVGCYFDAKSDSEIPGLSYFVRRSFLLGLREFEVVNDGSDTGRAGLRQLKESLRPAAMHVEYRGRQRGG